MRIGFAAGALLYPCLNLALAEHFFSVSLFLFFSVSRYVTNYRNYRCRTMVADFHYCSIQLCSLPHFRFCTCSKYFHLNTQNEDVATRIVGKLSMLASLKRRTQYSDQVVLPSGVSEAVLEPRAQRELKDTLEIWQKDHGCIICFTCLARRDMND